MSDKTTHTEAVIDSSTLLGVEYHLERNRYGIASSWWSGSLAECEAELEACSREIKNFDPKTWRIVRVERHIVTPNAKVSLTGQTGEKQ